MAETAAAKLRLDRGQEVVGLALLEVEVRVAGDPEGVVLADLHVREQPGQVGGDQLLEGDKARSPAERNETGQQRRHLHPRKALFAGAGILDQHRQVERQVRDVREWVPRIDGERRENGEDVLLEDTEQPGPFLFVKVVDAREENVGRGQAGHERLLEDLVAARLHAYAFGTDVLKLLRGGPTVG